MKIFQSALLLLSCLMFQACSFLLIKDAATRNRELLQSQIDSVLDRPILSPGFIGIKIVSLEDSIVLYERNSNKLFHPASNMKLLTTSTAVSSLDKDYKFTTTVSTDGSLKFGLLRGNLYVKGSGDPLIMSNDLDSIVTLIEQSGVQTIAGDLIGDVTTFDDVPLGSGWMWDDEQESYEASITPLTVNSNSIKIAVMPGKAIGDSLAYNLEPTTRYVTIINKGITSSDTTLPALNVTRRKSENTIVIQGRLAPEEKSQDFELSVWKPELYFLELLKEKLSEHFIDFYGSARLDTSKGTAQIYEISHPIDSVLRQINKPSDNLAAENLLKTLAAVKHGLPGTSDNGLTIVKQYLSSIGADTTKMTLADGSGLSFYNIVSPDALVRILQGQYADKPNFKRFYESLPIAGVDGTLKNRMKRTRAEGNVHAKTGTISAVSTLSGYVTTADAKLLCFSIMGNHLPITIAPLRQAQDKIMELLSTFPSLRP